MYSSSLLTTKKSLFGAIFLHMSEKNTTFDLLPLVFNRGPFECYIRILRFFKDTDLAALAHLEKKVVNSTDSPLFSTGAPSNVTFAFCGI